MMDRPSDKTNSPLWEIDKTTETDKKKHDARSYGFWLLNRRSYSSFKLKQKIEKKYSQEETQKAIQSLLKEGWMDDILYAQSKSREWIQRGFSVYYIQKKLEREKLSLSEEQIFDLYEELGLTEKDQIIRLIQKKLKKVKNFSELKDIKKMDYKIKQKLIQAALSKGHHYGEIQKALLEIQTHTSADTDHIFSNS